MKLEVLTTTTCLALLLSGSTLGCIPSDVHNGRPANGELKCYGCNSDERPLCSLANWKYANKTVRRVMNKQCPGRLSSFCYLKLTLNHSGYTERGCFRDRLGDNRKATVGCFNYEKFRVCLCAKNFCNSAPPADLAGLASPLFMLLLTLLTSKVRSL